MMSNSRTRRRERDPPNEDLRRQVKDCAGELITFCATLRFATRSTTGGTPTSPTVDPKTRVRVADADGIPLRGEEKTWKAVNRGMTYERG